MQSGWTDDMHCGLSMSFHFIKKGLNEQHLYEAIQEVDVKLQRDMSGSPDIFHYLLRGCINEKDPVAGRQVHSLMVKEGLDGNIFLGSHLIHMYSSCGSLLEANKVFKKLPEKNVFTWSTAISAHVKLGEANRAIVLYHKMQNYGVKPNQCIFVTVLKACAATGDLAEGKLIHGNVTESGFGADVFVGCTLIDMYAKCGNLGEAYRVFGTLPTRNVVTWNAMLAGFAHHGHGQEVLQFFHKMQQAGVKPDRVTFLIALKAISDISSLQEGILMHACIVENGLQLDVSVCSALIDMYCKCRSLKDARKVFTDLPCQNAVTWNAMIAGYIQNGRSDMAFQLFQQMKQEGLQVDNVTFTVVLKACSSLKALDQGKQIHAHISGHAFELHVCVGSALIDMYCKCGSLKDACSVFEILPVQTVVTWNALIAGYVHHGRGQQALEVFQQMQKEGMEPDIITFLNILKGCSTLTGLNVGKMFHILVVKNSFETDVRVGSILIDMYSKCGSLDDAYRVFDLLRIRNEVTWNAIISGHICHGNGQEALHLVEKMKQEGMGPDEITFASMLNACTSLAALGQGKIIHSFLADDGLESDLFLCNILIDMYAKCGSLSDSCKVFEKMPNRDVVAWNTMIAGYAQHSDYTMALLCFQSMQGDGLKPDDVTFFGLLSACSHGCRVAEACLHFKSMQEDYGLTPKAAHFYCVADLIARAGCLNEAQEFLQTMPFTEFINVGWMSLLSHCRIHGDMELGRHCFDCAATMDCRDASGYVHMSKLYLDAGIPVDTFKIDEQRRRADA